MGPNKNRFYVQNGKVYPLTDDVPAEIIISDDDDVSVLGNKFPIGSIAHNLADGTTFVLDPTYTWLQKGSNSNDGESNNENAVNGVFFINEYVDETDDSLVLNKTFSEIKAAIESGKYPIVISSDSDDNHKEYMLCASFHVPYDEEDPEDIFSMCCYQATANDLKHWDGNTEDDYPRRTVDQDTNIG